MRVVSRKLIKVLIRKRVENVLSIGYWFISPQHHDTIFYSLNSGRRPRLGAELSPAWKGPHGRAPTQGFGIQQLEGLSQYCLQFPGKWGTQEGGAKFPLGTGSRAVKCQNGCCCSKAWAKVGDCRSLQRGQDCVTLAGAQSGALSDHHLAIIVCLLPRVKLFPSPLYFSLLRCLHHIISPSHCFPIYSKQM